MLHGKSLKIKKRSATINFYSPHRKFEGRDKSDIIAFALLTGFYNPLKKYSINQNPIDIERLNYLKQKFDDLLYEVKRDMNVYYAEFDEISNTVDKQTDDG